MTEYELRQKVADMARSYLGCKESDGSHKAIIDLYNMIRPLPRGYHLSYTDPWCAAFVSVVFFNCGLLSIAPAECSCGYMIEERDDYDAQIGDVVFYDWEDDGRGDDVGSSDHVGVITGKRSGSFIVTEGNKSDAVGNRTLAVNGRYIRGFGLPDYASMVDVAPQPQPEPEPAPDPVPVPENNDTYNLQPNYLRFGAGMNELERLKPQVRALQELLIAAGYSCGPEGADGEFGSNTESAVWLYQYDHKLTTDMEVGPATMGKLLGIS